MKLVNVLTLTILLFVNSAYTYKVTNDILISLLCGVISFSLICLMSGLENIEEKYNM